MSEQTCSNCRHYLRHYAFDSRKLFRVYCGHCTLNRPRGKLPDAKACKNFVPGPPPEEAFASKEYLSKELIQYLLHLELLPKIEEEECGIQ